MNERSFARKKRDTKAKRQRPVLLIVAEGENVTESQYFRHFQKQNAGYSIKMVIAKHTTDPKGMLTALERQWKSLDLSESKGDAAYIVLDLDCNDNKAHLIKELSQKSKNAQFVVSNPCFEVWFLLHFRYSTHSFINSNMVVQELRNYLPEYRKNLDIYATIACSTDTALENAKRLKEYYKTLNYEWPSAVCNPCTDVPVIIEKIRKELVTYE